MSSESKKPFVRPYKIFTICSLLLGSKNAARAARPCVMASKCSKPWKIHKNRMSPRALSDISHRLSSSASDTYDRTYDRTPLNLIFTMFLFRKILHFTERNENVPACLFKSSVQILGFREGCMNPSFSEILGSLSVLDFGINQYCQ